MEDGAGSPANAIISRSDQIRCCHGKGGGKRSQEFKGRVVAQLSLPQTSTAQAGCSK
jgi:hypothetical protein